MHPKTIIILLLNPRQGYRAKQSLLRKISAGRQKGRAIAVGLTTQDVTALPFKVRDLMKYLEEHQPVLPNGGVLTPRRLQQLGIRFGGHGNVV